MEEVGEAKETARGKRGFGSTGLSEDIVSEKDALSEGNGSEKMAKPEENGSEKMAKPEGL